MISLAERSICSSIDFIRICLPEPCPKVKILLLP
jgi:hypothetical protein